MFGDLVPLGYATALSFRPLSLCLGVYWVAKKPALARQGRIALCWAIAQVTLWLGVSWVAIVWAALTWR